MVVETGAGSDGGALVEPRQGNAGDAVRTEVESASVGRAAFAGLVANYTVCFALDFLPFTHKPHILLYGFFGMVACLAVASAVSLLQKQSISTTTATVPSSRLHN